MIAEVRKKTSLPLWRSSKEVCSWFDSLDGKKKLKFIKYDIVEYYPSISEGILMKAISWAREYADISDMEVEIILHSRKSFLFHQGSTWIKNTNGKNFDCPMGSLDSAEVSDLISLYMLHKLSSHIDVRRSGG